MKYQVLPWFTKSTIYSSTHFLKKLTWSNCFLSVKTNVSAQCKVKAYLPRIFPGLPWAEFPYCLLCQKTQVIPSSALSWVYDSALKSLTPPTPPNSKEANYFATQTFLKLSESIKCYKFHLNTDYTNKFLYKPGKGFLAKTPQDVTDGEIKPAPTRSPAVKPGGLWKNIRRQQEAWAPSPQIRKSGQPGTLQKHEILQFSQYFPSPMLKN